LIIFSSFQGKTLNDRHNHDKENIYKLGCYGNLYYIMHRLLRATLRKKVVYFKEYIFFGYYGNVILLSCIGCSNQGTVTRKCEIIINFSRYNEKSITITKKIVQPAKKNSIK